MEQSLIAWNSMNLTDTSHETIAVSRFYKDKSTLYIYICTRLYDKSCSVYMRQLASWVSLRNWINIISDSLQVTSDGWRYSIQFKLSEKRTQSERDFINEFH